MTGSSIHVTCPFRLPGQDGPVHRRPAPTLGQHNVEILREVVALTVAVIEALRERHVIGDEPAM